MQAVPNSDMYLQTGWRVHLAECVFVSCSSILDALTSIV